MSDPSSNVSRSLLIDWMEDGSVWFTVQVYRTAGDVRTSATVRKERTNLATPYPEVVVLQGLDLLTDTLHQPPLY